MTSQPQRRTKTAASGGRRLRTSGGGGGGGGGGGANRLRFARLPPRLESNASKAAPDGFGAAEHVLLIGIDGITPRALNDAIARGDAPSLAALRSRGAWSDEVRVTQPSSSLSSWASILTGSPPEMHGVHLAAQLRSEYPVRPAALDAHAHSCSSTLVIEHTPLATLSGCRSESPHPPSPQACLLPGGCAIPDALHRPARGAERGPL